MIPADPDYELISAAMQTQRGKYANKQAADLAKLITAARSIWKTPIQDVIDWIFETEHPVNIYDLYDRFKPPMPPTKTSEQPPKQTNLFKKRQGK